MPDVKYTRTYGICMNFASGGACARKECIFSHTLLDTARVAALVGELPPLCISSADDKTYFLIEYTKYSAILDGVEPNEKPWRMRLLAGGRATLHEAGLGTDARGSSVSVQPVYPTKGQGRGAGEAIDALERRVFGRSYPVSTIRSYTYWFTRLTSTRPWLARPLTQDHLQAAHLRHLSLRSRMSVQPHHIRHTPHRRAARRSRHRTRVP